MKKGIKTKCSVCGKLGYFIQYISGASFYEHSRKRSEIKILGRYVFDVQGCYIPGWKNKGWVSKEAYDKYLEKEKAPTPVNA